MKNALSIAESEKSEVRENTEKKKGGRMIDFVCLSAKGERLEEDDRIFLTLAGCEMAQKGQMRRKIKDDGIKGDIFTNFRRATIGSLSGVAFEAEITTPKGDIGVRYLISDLDLDKRRSELMAGKQRWQTGDSYLASLIWDIVGKTLQGAEQYS